MRVGLSFSRCVRDLVEGVVSMDQVLVVIARTRFDPENDAHWQEIWAGYQQFPNQWSIYDQLYEPQFREVTLRLHREGKLFQPRQHGVFPSVPRYHWLETVLLDQDLDSNPSLRSAWDNFQMIAGLSGINLKRDQ
jgi:hypothetical protein